MEAGTARINDHLRDDRRSGEPGEPNGVTTFSAVKARNWLRALPPWEALHPVHHIQNDLHIQIGELTLLVIPLGLPFDALPPGFLGRLGAVVGGLVPFKKLLQIGIIRAGGLAGTAAGIAAAGIRPVTPIRLLAVLLLPLGIVAPLVFLPFLVIPALVLRILVLLILEVSLAFPAAVVPIIHLGQEGCPVPGLVALHFVLVQGKLI